MNTAAEELLQRTLRLAAAGAGTGAVIGGTISHTRGGSFAKGAVAGAAVGLEVGGALGFARDPELMARIKELKRR